MSGSPPFHLAFPVRDLEEARGFYGGLLGCREGRSAATWVDFDFFGHQLSAHLVHPPAGAGPAGPELETATNEVDSDDVPVRHFGVVLPMASWRALAERLRAAGVAFLIEPRTRFRGETGEQATFFVRDPSGNALEFKAFERPERLFSGD